MAGVCLGFSDPESVALTSAMLRCGERLDLASLDKVAVDCCSSGGVGDKVQLIAAPIAASAGVAVPMIVERGAGHVIGTLEKLKSIPGFRTTLELSDFSDLVGQYGLAFVEQSNALAPADKKLSELRAETATVDSLPLMAASAMSKKLAEDLRGLVVDVKVSRGSPVSNRADARRLAQLMIRIGRHLKVEVQALLTDMEQPLGYTVGNALEIMEVAQTLQGQGPPDLAGLSIEIAARMIYLADPTISIEDARVRATAAVEDGSALQTLSKVIGAQGGNPDVLQDFAELPNPQGAVPVMSPREGFVSRINAQDIGRAAVMLGASAEGPQGKADPAVGVVLETKVGQQVFNGTRLCALYYNDESTLEEAQELVEDAFRISSNPPPARELVLDLIQG